MDPEPFWGPNSSLGPKPPLKDLCLFNPLGGGLATQVFGEKILGFSNLVGGWFKVGPFGTLPQRIALSAQFLSKVIGWGPEIGPQPKSKSV